MDVFLDAYSFTDLAAQLQVRPEAKAASAELVHLASWHGGQASPGTLDCSGAPPLSCCILSPLSPQHGRTSLRILPLLDAPAYHDSSVQAFI